MYRLGRSRCLPFPGPGRPWLPFRNSTLSQTVSSFLSREQLCFCLPAATSGKCYTRVSSRRSRTAGIHSLELNQGKGVGGRSLCHCPLSSPLREAKFASPESLILSTGVREEEEEAHGLITRVKLSEPQRTGVYREVGGLSGSRSLSSLHSGNAMWFLSLNVVYVLACTF